MTRPPFFVIDTSALIDLEEWYPKDTFPSVWQAMEDLAQDGRLRCPQEVSRELEQKSPELKKWLEKRAMALSDQETVDLAQDAADIDRKYPELKTGRRRSSPNPRSADPWVVAFAVKRGGVVVSSERPQPNAQTVRKIPDACRAEKVRCLTLQQLFQELKLRL